MAILLHEERTDFSFGMIDGAAGTAMPLNAVSSIINGRIEPDATISRRSGTIRLHPTALNDDIGYGGTRFTDAAGQDYLVVIFGDKAFRSIDRGATWVEIGTGLHQDYYTFATMRVGAINWLFLANGGPNIKRYDGTTFEDLPNVPADVPFVATFNGRLYITGHNGVLVQGSKIADPTNWTSPDALTVQVATSDGDPPTGMYQIGPHLLIYERNSTSYIDGFGQQTTIVAAGATGFSRSVGCVAFRTITGVGDNGVAWLSERGIEYYTPGQGISLVSKAIQTFLKSIDWDQLYNNPGRPSGAYDELDQNYHLALPTSGVRNNRTVVIDLLQNIIWRRPGPRAAIAIDQQRSTVGGDLVFGGDSDGYLEDTMGGAELKADADKYMSLAGAGEAGVPISGDADGYLSEVTEDTLPATLFIAPITERSVAIHSVGYDGFVRKHFGQDNDDTLSDGTGGLPVSMTIVSGPLLFGRPRQRKRVRAIHVAGIADEEATLTVLVRGRGQSTPATSKTLPSTQFGQARRIRTLVSMIAESPQVEVRTEDRVKISLIGLSAHLMRESIT